MKYRTVSVKFEEGDYHKIKKVSEVSNGGEMSGFIREAVISKLNSGAISNIAGKNEIDYNPEKNNFSWKILLDNGEETEILKDVSGDFIKDLSEQLKLQLKKQEELLVKKNKKSVAVPRGLAGK
jgi:hypothetical protein